jgi:hypothetical protein
MPTFRCWDEETDDTMDEDFGHDIEARNARDAAEKLCRDIMDSGDYGTFPITVRAPDGTVTRWDVEVTEPTFCANPRPALTRTEGTR